MKRSKKLCILLGILIAVCLAALVAMLSEEKKEEIKTSGETVLSVESAKVTALCWEQDGTTWSFHRGDDGSTMTMQNFLSATAPWTHFWSRFAR